MNSKSADLVSTATVYYEQKLNEIAGWEFAAREKRFLLSLTRLITMVIVLMSGYLAWQHQELLWLIGVGVGLIAFGRAIMADTDNNARVRRLEGLEKLIREERDFLTRDIPIKSNETIQGGDADHAYAYDLDIFGKGSIFSMINRCYSEPGRDLLAAWLLAPADREVILERQEAVKELAKDPDGLFDLAVICQQTPLRNQTIARILHWMEREDAPFREPYWALVRWIYPVITPGILGCYIGGIINGNTFGLFGVLFLAVSFAFSKRVIKHYLALSGIVKEVAVLSEGIKLIEGRSFTTVLNNRLQETLLRPQPASKEIRELDGLLHRFDIRLNPYVFIPLNAFLLWDLWQMHGLNAWRERNRPRVGQWTKTLGNVEALGCLALLHFNRPGWCFPEIAEEHFEFSAKGMGHPLIPEGKRVVNDFAAKGLGRLELVTGSNMAGKSTWLRTVGVNMVLAMAGCPVCASACRLSRVSVVSSMRIADNLEDSTSTFYAELKKLRSIIEKVKRHEHVFILLDEILRGTNSRDRLAGSRSLIRQLVREDAVGVIATHDLELAHMEDDLPGHIFNYYFDVQFYGDELGFDYTLRKGICTTKNAELLMKQIGIELA